MDPNTGTVSDHLNGAATIPEIVATNPVPDDGGNDGGNDMDNNPTPRPNVVQTMNTNGNSHVNPTPDAHQNPSQLTSTNVSTIVEVVSTNTQENINPPQEIQTPDYNAILNANVHANTMESDDDDDVIT